MQNIPRKNDIVSYADSCSCVHLIIYDTDATSDTPLIIMENGTASSLRLDWHLMDIPQSSKKTKSKWMNKKLRKLGR